jgi:hypothetical protein
VNEGCTTPDQPDPPDQPDQPDPLDTPDQTDQGDADDSSDDGGVDQGESGAIDPVDHPQNDPATAPTHVNDYGMPSACSLNQAQDFVGLNGFLFFGLVFLMGTLRKKTT